MGNPIKLGSGIEQEWLSLDQASRLLGVSADTFRRRIAGRYVPVTRIPGLQPRVKRADVVAVAERFTEPVVTRSS
jgi:excisionase family DNA binding protein